MSENRKQEFATDIVDKSSGRLANFEEAIFLTGYGRYNIKLLLVCGIILTSAALQFGLSAYIIPSAQCELELSSSEMGLLNAGFMIGSAIGGLISGAIADAIGRKKILCWFVFIDGCVAILSGLSQNFPTLFLFRCINGLIIGGPATIIFSFLGEFHAEKSKSKVLCYLGLFFVNSWVLLPALAWIILPLKFNIVVFGLVFNSWRLFLSIAGFPSLLGAFLLSKYPETPKFLLSQGEDVKALQIMKQIFVSNTKRKEHEYPIKMLISDCPTNDEKIHSLSATVLRMWKQLCCLLRPPFRKYIILISFIIFANMAGYYGLGLWLPELLNRFETHYKSHPNVTTTVCELAYLRQEAKNALVDTKSLEYLNTKKNLTFQMISQSVLSVTTTVQPSIDNTTLVCNSSIDSQVFINTIITGCCCLLGTLASAHLITLLERRIMPMITMLVPGVCGCAIYFLRTSTQNLIVTCIFAAFISMSNIIIYSLTVDVFPTNVNAIAVSVIAVSGRLGAILSNLVFGLLLDISCEVPIFLIGGIIILGGILGILLPRHPISVPKTIG